MKNKIILLIVLGVLLYACSEEPVGQQPTDNVSPGLVSNVTVENRPGGAKLTYSLPDNEDLLYVKALYSRREGEISESKASIYADSLIIEGYGNTDSHEVEIVAVDRSRNESAPVNVTITPLEPPVNTIASTLDLIEDFGGISCTWINETNAKIGVFVQEKDDLLDEFVTLESFYSERVDGKFSVYGLDTIQKTFQTYIEDRWENRSPIKEFTLAPLYETEYDKGLFGEVVLPGDAPPLSVWPMRNIWNGTPNPAGYSSLEGTGLWPQSITIDLGTLGLLSRIRVYQRKENEGYIFAVGNLKKFEIWGAETLDLSGNWDSWTKLGEFESIKPSGLPYGQINDEDRAVATNGEDFSFSSTNPKVRYIRILVTETWAGGDNFQIMELDIFGDNR